MGLIRAIIVLLTVVLLPGQPWAQMPRGFVDAASVVDGLIVDGADAARFLATMKARLEEGQFEA